VGRQEAGEGGAAVPPNGTTARARSADESASRLRLLTAAAREFAEATQELEQLLNAVARRMAQVVKDQCVVRLISADGRKLDPVAVHGADAEAERFLREMYASPLPLEKYPAARRVHESGEPFVVPKVDLEAVRENTTPEVLAWARRIGIHSLLILPLRHRGVSFGQLVLTRYRSESPSYDEQDLDFASALADHAAIAIANARSFAAERTARAAAEQATLDLQESVSERLRLEQQLRQAQRMESVGRLAGGIAHDFNNMLSVILSYSDMLLGDLKPDDPVRADVEEIRKAGTRGGELTRQLLLFSRKQVTEPKVLDLNDVLGGMDRLLQRLLGADVDLVSLPTRPLGRVRMDRGSIEQVILNLVVNARDAMPTGGKLTMETADVVHDAEYARTHHGVAAGPYVMLAVSDTGVGMDKATLERIFEPFFTAKEKGEGAGLGLSTVFGIVRQAGGSVWVYSEPGKGTTFKVYLPRIDAELESPRASQPPTTLLGSETILLVEDDDQVRAVALGILRRNGYRVIEARDAGDALLRAEEVSGRIDLLLTDVVMPRMSGPELAKRLAGVRPELKVLCMSGYTDDSIVRHGVLESHFAYVQKPLTPDVLTSRVREVLDAGRGS
jgi:signal transduction histidine kinase